MRVTARSKRNLQVDIQASNHTLVADEPRRDGGDDAGPNPYDLLLSALGACKVMTVHMYARRKEWPVESVTVDLDHDRIHARDCEDCESDNSSKIDIITCEISYEGDLDDDQIKRLTEIADRCPVHRTLTNELKIRTTAVELTKPFK